MTDPDCRSAVCLRADAFVARVQAEVAARAAAQAVSVRARRLLRHAAEQQRAEAAALRARADYLPADDVFG